MKKFKYILILFILLAVAGLAYGAYYVYNNVIETDEIYKGVYVEDYDLSNKTKEEALEYLREEKEKDKLKTMKLMDGENHYTMPLEEIGFEYKYDEAIDEAYSLGRDGSLLERYKVIKELEKNKIEIELESYYSDEKIKEVVDRVSNGLDREAKDATFNFNGGNFIVEKEENGKKVDREKLSKLIKENIYVLEDLEIPVEIIEANRTEEMYKRINGVIGYYSTSFPNSSPGRKSNIALSAKLLDGKLIHPGETFSYNKATGPRRRDMGYEEAPIILDGEYTPGVGGGVCQTSTTFYNSILLADLKLVQRSPHSIPPGYVPNGTDAAVNDGGMDLIFRNDFDYPIYISSWTENDKVHISIYGDQANRDYTVRIEPELVEQVDYKIVEQADPSLAPGTRQLKQKGRTGYVYKTYKLKIRNGEVIEKQHITTDHYRGRDEIYLVGPGA